MSKIRLDHEAKAADRAAIFAALGDETRLMLVARLSGEPSQSISRLAKKSPFTRQAITRHLRVLEGAGLVQGVRAGRESQFTLTPERLREAKSYLERVSAQWEGALARLKAFAED